MLLQHAPFHAAEICPAPALVPKEGEHWQVCSSRGALPKRPGRWSTVSKFARRLVQDIIGAPHPTRSTLFDHLMIIHNWHDWLKPSTASCFHGPMLKAELFVFFARLYTRVRFFHMHWLHWWANHDAYGKCVQGLLPQWGEDCAWCLLVRTNQRLKRKPKHRRRLRRGYPGAW